MTIENAQPVGTREAACERMPSLERIRQEVAGVLDLAPEEVPDELNLIEIGLHSLAIMTLLGPISRLAGVRLDYADLAAVPTVRAWSALVEHKRAAVP
ncbi:phosphopantetheine-binding protein [Labrys sp. WJW]|uniref:phosphopantetheine-binding protein n=1 Tax=Labrys sp. WJW TaxID=1737983 RepID=UPI001FD89643|nr:phosphopantetheine-binding protein [Labrys sp. WJW]